MNHFNKAAVISQCSLDVETTLFMSVEGIEVGVFIGETEEPQMEGRVSFKVLIDDSLDVLGFGGGFEAYEEVAEFVGKLKSLHEYAEKRVKELGWEVEV